MTNIFVSYRRDDSQWQSISLAERMEQSLGLGRVFFDTITIQPGDDFHEVLGSRVGECRVLVAVIGPRWQEILATRSVDSNDFVRIEIAEALRRGIRVVPVLIDGAKLPTENQLPSELKPLARRNAVHVRAETFRADADRLIGFLETFLKRSQEAGRKSFDGRPAASLPAGNRPDAGAPHSKEVSFPPGRESRLKSRTCPQVAMNVSTHDEQSLLALHDNIRQMESISTTHQIQPARQDGSTVHAVLELVWRISGTAPTAALQNSLRRDLNAGFHVEIRAELQLLSKLLVKRLAGTNYEKLKRSASERGTLLEWEQWMSERMSRRYGLTVALISYQCHRA